MTACQAYLIAKEHNPSGSSRLQPAAGKTVAWINYMTNINKTFGNFAVNANEAFMVLNINKTYNRYSPKKPRECTKNRSDSRNSND